MRLYEKGYYLIRLSYLVNARKLCVCVCVNRLILCVRFLFVSTVVEQCFTAVSLLFDCLPRV